MIELNNMNYKQPLIKSYQMRPIPRGWSMEWTIGDRTQTFNGQIPSKTINAIKRWVNVNGAEVSDDMIWLECNIEWLQRTEVSRHMGGNATLPYLLDLRDNAHLERKGKLKDAMKFAPNVWGDRVWNYWALLTARSTWNQEEWDMAIKTGVALLDSEVEKVLGCASCYEDTMEYFEKDSPYDKKNAEDATTWLRNFHNHVNDKLGREKFTIRDYDIKHFRS